MVGNNRLKTLGSAESFAAIRNHDTFRTYFERNRAKANSINGTTHMAS